jgi:hypothetical protein
MSVRDLASVVGKLNSLEPAFGPAILVGTRIIAIQVSETALQFGWKKGFLLISEDSRSPLRRVSYQFGFVEWTPDKESRFRYSVDFGFAKRGPVRGPKAAESGRSVKTC